MVTKKSFQSRMAVFTTHNVEIMKQAERYRKAHAAGAELTPVQKEIIAEGEDIQKLMDIQRKKFAEQEGQVDAPVVAKSEEQKAGSISEVKIDKPKARKATKKAH